MVLTPIMHDTAGELAQPFDVKDWKKGEIDLIPGVTAPQITVVERDYPNTFKRFTALGPLLDKVGNGGKGIGWNTQTEVEQLGDLNGRVREEGVTQGRPKIVTDIDATEVVMMLAPETNGHVACKAWEALGKQTGRDHVHLALHREDEKIRFRDIQAQPRKIISSPTWSGLESEKVSYNAGYTNVHELIPWRTLTGRQQFYQDHPWMRDFGEGFVSYRPPVHLKALHEVQGKMPNGNPEIALNFITPHQKWGIHSTYSDNLHMLTLTRGGPVIWLSEDDAKRGGIVDNDWVELFNANGAIAARAVVSQRVKQRHGADVPRPGKDREHPRLRNHRDARRHPQLGHPGGLEAHAHDWRLRPDRPTALTTTAPIGTNRDEFVVVREMCAASIGWMLKPKQRPNTPEKEGEHNENSVPKSAWC